MCSPKICTLYSLTGILFLLFVYTILSTQSFYIRGITPANNDTAKRNALGGMLLFVVMFVASLGYSFWKNNYWSRWRNNNGGGSQYELIDGASERTLE
jgi:hypothetical protein